jgi:hypothetical protein
MIAMTMPRVRPTIIARKVSTRVRPRPARISQLKK